MQLNVKLDTIIVGYAMSATVFCIGLALSARAMHQASGDSAWIGLSTIMFPLGMSFVIFLVTEGVKALQSGEEQ